IVILDVGVEEVTSTRVDVGKVLVELSGDKTIIAMQKADMRYLRIRHSSCDRFVERRVETCVRLRYKNAIACRCHKRFEVFARSVRRGCVNQIVFDLVSE